MSFNEFLRTETKKESGKPNSSATNSNPFDTDEDVKIKKDSERNKSNGNSPFASPTIFEEDASPTNTIKKSNGDDEDGNEEIENKNRDVDEEAKQDYWKLVINRAKRRLILLLLLVLLPCWGVTIYDIIAPSENSPTKLGIYPRRISGAIGIPLHFFINPGASVIPNSIGIFGIGYALLVRSYKETLSLAIFVTLFEGFCVWGVGREAYHFGAGGVVLGCYFYLICVPCFETPFRPKPFIATLIVGIIFAAALYFVFTDLFDDDVSYELLISGTIAGILAVVAWHKFGKQHYETRKDLVKQKLSNYLVLLHLKREMAAVNEEGSSDVETGGKADVKKENEEEDVELDEIIAEGFKP
eukprot:TRINITY_DN7802_c0_g1_i1.p1 TRINITY_DN7802_c0_g1~~TRINITY_DN7802_c0_g1_i1.p1  ORF type:complete len:356 (-),score=68.52 TRINITY_DN7802_c0_g1_i1:27-1094(-)